MTIQGWHNVAVLARMPCASIAFGLLFMVREDRRPRQFARPDWERVLADTLTFAIRKSSRATARRPAPRRRVSSRASAIANRTTTGCPTAA